MKYLKNEEAVSPVIGVILMVVITVIIAAIVAVFAFGLGAPAKAPQTSLKLEINPTTATTIDLRHYGGDQIDWARVTPTLEGTGTAAFPTTGIFKAGELQSGIVTGGAGVDRVIIVDTATQQVIMDSKITVS